MYCFKCGQELPDNTTVCPECDSPQVKTRNRKRRMILGILLFLAGGLTLWIVTALFSGFFSKDPSWKESPLRDKTQTQIAEQKTQKTTPELPDKQPKESIQFSSDKNLKPSADSLSQQQSAQTSAKYSVPEKPETKEPEIAKASDVSTAQTATKPKTEAPAEVTFGYTPFDTQTADKYKISYQGQVVVEGGDNTDMHVSLSNAGDELIFVSKRDGANFQCYIKNPPITGKAKLEFKWLGNVWTPDLTPDGNMIIFSSDSAKPEHIFLYDRKSKYSIQLTKGTSKNMMCNLSPDGQQIAFVSNRQGKNAIMTMDLTGGNLKALTDGKKYDDREPRWTPDGKSIIFSRIIKPMEQSNIMIVPATGGEPKPLVENGKRNWMPDLSPDGNTLAFTTSQSKGGSNNTIILKDLTTGKETPLKMPGVYEAIRPIWNKDLSGFAFHSISSKTKRTLHMANIHKEKI
ncbi:MAG: hypothetical protein GX221_06125 [Candidatus Riflebacteria bacterium]|nr:hypothetical protein [Candidatus Riflebacteria bacterium]